MPDRGKVYVIDDDEAMRDSLNFLLDSANYKVTLFETALKFLDALPSLAFGCVVSDVRMPGLDGIELLKRMQAGHSTFPIVIMTGHGDVPLAVEAMKAGAIDFIEKPFDEQAILSAVHGALDRGTTSDRAGEGQVAVSAKLALLSERERQVLEGLISGYPNKTIAHDLGISPRTVEVYRANLMTKMQAKSLSELIRMAIIAQISLAGRVSK